MSDTLTTPRRSISPQRQAWADVLIPMAMHTSTTWKEIADRLGILEGQVVQLVADLRVNGVPIAKRAVAKEWTAPPIRFTLRGCPGTISGHDPERARAFISAMGGVCHG